MRVPRRRGGGAGQGSLPQFSAGVRTCPLGGSSLSEGGVADPAQNPNPSLSPQGQGLLSTTVPLIGVDCDKRCPLSSQLRPESRGRHCPVTGREGGEGPNVGATRGPGTSGLCGPSSRGPTRPLPEASCGEAALPRGPLAWGSPSPGERSWPGLRGVAHAGPFVEGNVSLPETQAATCRRSCTAALTSCSSARRFLNPGPDDWGWLRTLRFRTRLGGPIGSNPVRGAGDSSLSFDQRTVSWRRPERQEVMKARFARAPPSPAIALASGSEGVQCGRDDALSACVRGLTGVIV